MSRPWRRPVPGRRADERRLGLGCGGGRFAPGAEARCDHRHAGAVGAHDRAGRVRRRGRHDVHAVPARGRRLPQGGVGGADPRRGAVRQEPPGQDLPLRARAGGAVQAGDHRDPDGEQPNGAVVAAVDHSSRAVPRPATVCRAVRAADRARRRQRAARAPAAPDQAAAQAPHKAVGGRGSSRQAGTDPRRGAASAPSQALRHAPAARAPEGARADRRLQPQPLHDPALDHAAAPAQPAPGARRRRPRHRPLREARRARRAAGRRRRRWPPRARVQPVHGLPRQGPRAAGRRGHRLLLPRRRAPAGASACWSASRTAATLCS